MIPPNRARPADRRGQHELGIGRALAFLAAGVAALLLALVVLGPQLVGSGARVLQLGWQTAGFEPPR